MLQQKTCSLLLTLSSFGIKRIIANESRTITKRNNHTLGKAIQWFRFNYMYNLRHHLDNDKWAKVFAIEGNIGVGKNEFGKKFSEILDLKYYPTTTLDYVITRLRGKYPDEYIEYMLCPDSVHSSVYNLSFDYFSQNPTDWIHTSKLQLFMLRNRYFQYCDALAYLFQTGRGVVTNRTFFSDRIFADAQRKLGWLRNDVYDFYDCVTISAHNNIMHPQVVIYLDVPAEQCYENAQAGNNEIDKRFSLDFFKRIEQAYKEIYFTYARERGVNVIEIDWRNPTPVEEVVEYIDEIKELEAANSSWKDKVNSQFKRMLKVCRDDRARTTFLDLFTSIDELWATRDQYLASVDEYYAMPFGRPKGFNRKMGDNVLLKHIKLFD